MEGVRYYQTYHHLRLYLLVTATYIGYLVLIVLIMAKSGWVIGFEKHENWLKLFKK